jgi:excisionase family DNA binding protein
MISRPPVAKTECAEISVSVAARIAKCSRDTVLRWVEEGAVEARRTSLPRGWWKIERSSLERYLERRSGKTAVDNSANGARISRAAVPG